MHNYIWKGSNVGLWSQTELVKGDVTHWVLQEADSETAFSIQDVYFYNFSWNQHLWEGGMGSKSGYREKLSSAAASVSFTGSSAAKTTRHSCPSIKLKWPGLSTPTSVM